jgi:peptidoglycan/xylan/chitin deacetylase (PgdA/CDA1 family)
VTRISPSLKRRLSSFAHGSHLTTLVRGRFAGCGAILLFHEIHNDLASELMTGVSPSFLDAGITWLKSNGWTFVSLDEAIDRITEPRASSRFICITFDDGYRDNLLHALPVLERHKAPFTLYVPTEAITRNLYSWWLGVRRLFMTRDVVDIELMRSRFHCRDLDSKIAGLRAVTEWISQDYRRKPMLAPTFTHYDIPLAQINDEYFLNDKELQLLGGHRLATVAAHTATHAALSTLDATSARLEMTKSRAYLEEFLQKPVRHFAYPYGNAGSCGPREGIVAAEAGFKSAVTTRPGQIRIEHADHLHALPRFSIDANDTVASLDARVSGLGRALRGQSQLITW